MRKNISKDHRASSLYDLPRGYSEEQHEVFQHYNMQSQVDAAYEQLINTIHGHLRLSHEQVSLLPIYFEIKRDRIIHTHITFLDTQHEYGRKMALALSALTGKPFQQKRPDDYDHHKSDHHDITLVCHDGLTLDDLHRAIKLATHPEGIFNNLSKKG